MTPVVYAAMPIALSDAGRTVTDDPVECSSEDEAIETARLMA
jgi:hypothetical protein